MFQIVKRDLFFSVNAQARYSVRRVDFQPTISTEYFVDIQLRVFANGNEFLRTQFSSLCCASAVVVVSVKMVLLLLLFLLLLEKKKKKMERDYSMHVVVVLVVVYKC